MWKIILSSIIKNWTSPDNIFVSTKTENTQNMLVKKYNINIRKNIDSDIIILAVKPQNFNEINFEDFSPDALIVSIMAWVSIDKIDKVLCNSKIIKCMPNTPMSIWEWVIWYYINNWISWVRVNFIMNIFENIWKLIKVDSEDKIDMITSLSGSWPAYFYYFTEILKKKALEFWFSEKESIIIANNTLIWSAYLLDKSESSLENLRSNVTSKWWTTQKAIESFQNDWLENIFKKWIENAYQRAKTINK